MAQSNPNQKMIVGNLEFCNLPELGIVGLEIRVDTGAKTSSLHVDNIERFQRRGETWVAFDIHPDVYEVEKVLSCQSRLHSIRKIKSSNALSEKRYVIETLIQFPSGSWPIEITLTNRADMNYLMLLGRQGMKDKILVDPSRSFVLGKPTA